MARWGAHSSRRLFLLAQRFIKHFNGRLYDANKRSVPTEALNPLRFDDDHHEFVIGTISGLVIGHA